MSIETIEWHLQGAQQFKPDRYIGRTLRFAANAFPDATVEAQHDVAHFVSAFMAGVRELSGETFGRRELIQLPAVRVESEQLVRKIVTQRAGFITNHVVHDNGTRELRESGVDGQQREKREAASEYRVQRFACGSHDLEIQRSQYFVEESWQAGSQPELLAVADRTIELGHVVLRLVHTDYVLVRDTETE